MKAIQIPLQSRFISNIFCYVQQRKYEVLLISFMLLIFGNTFAIHRSLTGIIDIYQHLVAGFVVFYLKKWHRHFILFIILASVALDFFDHQLLIKKVRSLHGIWHLLFFSLIVVEVYKQVLYVKTVSAELLSAALCGFVLLCLMATFLFYQIDIQLPHSFSNTGEGKEVLVNLNYFSFTTLLTIGYGDITPVALVAKRAVMLMGLMGHFYTVFITSIIIGKYLSLKNQYRHL